MNKIIFLVSPSSHKTSYRVSSDRMIFHVKKKRKKGKKSSKKCQTSGLLFESWKEDRGGGAERERERERMAGSYSHENDGHAWDESHSNGVPTRKVRARVSLGER